MEQVIQQHLQTLFDLGTDLANIMDEEKYAQKLSDLPSNTLGEQFACIIGARESQLKVLKVGKEFVFDCSVDDATNKLQIMQALFRSATDILSYVDQLGSDLDERQMNILLEVIEHEAQHHGQLIRYVYGNRWAFPKSWVEYYSL